MDEQLVWTSHPRERQTRIAIRDAADVLGEDLVNRSAYEWTRGRDIDRNWELSDEMRRLMEAFADEMTRESELKQESERREAAARKRARLEELARIRRRNAATSLLLGD